VNHIEKMLLTFGNKEK